MEQKDDAIKLLIIADDLTGANDAGVQFAKRGVPSVVMVEHGGTEFPGGYEVVVVNTESRHVPALEAARRVRHVAQLGLSAGVTHFFKKTDSTLRGNIGAELKALLEVTGEQSIPFVAAFPEMGRTTRGGIHYVEGKPISETAFASDPLSPVRESEVGKVLNQTSPLRVTYAAIENGALKPSFVGEAGECVVIDGEARMELTAVANHFAGANRLRVMSGSAGFVEELPAILWPKLAMPQRIYARGPILFINGSLNPRAFEQIAAGSELFQRIYLSPELLFGNEPVGIESLSDLGGDVLVCTLERRDDYETFRRRAHALGIAEEMIHRAVAEKIGEAVKRILTKWAAGTLIVFGGDTLIGISRAMGWTAFQPRCEVEPGITVSTPIGSEITVVSKAGGFGDADALRRIVPWIKG